MDRYKFRGKRLDNGEWVAGHYVTRRTNNEGLQHMISYQDMWGFHEVDPDTVGQYTGLKDKNGKEIYEGDVLKVPDLYELPENTSMTYHTELVDFEEFSFRLGGSLFAGDSSYISEECEVIGNRWDNPELLEG